jgi:hypothetical protein
MTMWIHGHVHMDIYGVVHIVHNQIPHIDTQPLAGGYMTMWIHGHVHVDTQLHACGYTPMSTWLHNQWTHKGPVLIQFEAGSVLWPIAQKTESAQWPTVLTQILHCGPQRLSRLCLVPQSKQANSVLRAIMWNDLKRLIYRQIQSYIYNGIRL